MLNKNDPLIGAVKQVMTQSDNERAAVKAVNEKFGVQDRKALPWQKQSEWDAAYKKVLSEGVSVLNEETQIDEIADTARGKERVRLAVHRADATVVDSAINPPRSKKGKREAKNAMKTIDRGIAVHKKKGGVLDSYLKRAYGLKKEENVNQQPSIESIHEEIAYNLYEQASYILENYGEEGLVQFFEALSEEEVAIFEANQAGTPVGDNVKSAISRVWNGAKKVLSTAAAVHPLTAATSLASKTVGSAQASTPSTSGSSTPKYDGPAKYTPASAASQRASSTTGQGQARQQAASISPGGTSSSLGTNKSSGSTTKASTPPAAAAAAKAKSKKTKVVSKTVGGSATKKSGLKAPGVKAVRKAPAGLRPQSRSVRDGLASDWRE